MANSERGEIEIIVNDKPYTLKVTMNASIAIQTRTKKTMGELINAATALDFEAIRDVVFMLLQKHHAAEFKTLTSVGDFIDDAGGVAAFFNALEQLAKANEVPGENPPIAQETSTGERLSEMPVASVA